MEEDPVPGWVKEGRSLLAQIVSNAGVIKVEGQAEARRGLEKAEAADDIQHEAEYLNSVFNQQLDPVYWNDEIIAASGIRLVNRLQVLDDQMQYLSASVVVAGERGEEEQINFIRAVSDSDSSSASALYLGAGMEIRFQAITPAYEPIMTYDQPDRLNSREELFTDLKTEVAEFGDKYVKMLEGSESALDLEAPDSLSQAAHSMRDCFQQLLEQLAPSGVVKAQPWFEPTDGAPGGVSRRSRLRYMLYGSGENVDESRLSRLDDLAALAKDSLDMCMARAHEHDPTLTHDEVRLAIDQARDALVRVLQVYSELRAS